MTDRDRILAAIRGDAVDRLPWIPRLEFWHRAKTRDGSLPAGLQGLSLREIADRLGVGYYAVVPDFTGCRREDDMLDQALGIVRLPSLLYQTTLEGVERSVERRGTETIMEYRTPVGSIRTSTIFTDEMLAAGASVPWTTGHAIREPRDFEVVGYIFSHMKVEPQSDGYRELCEQIGDRGIVVGYVSGMACPIHHIMKELMSVEQFFFAMHDMPEAVARLSGQMAPYYEQIQRIVADSPAEVALLGGNYDDTITYPPFFKEHFVPPLRKYAADLHRRGKYLMCHTDGENRKLLPLYREAGFDVADSVCPYPMTSCRIEELREAFAGRTAIWGGIPSVLLCPGSATTEQFRRFIDDLVERYGRQSRFVLGVSDMVTADADWDRLCYITEKVSAIH